MDKVIDIALKASAGLFVLVLASIAFAAVGMLIVVVAISLKWIILLGIVAAVIWIYWRGR